MGFFTILRQFFTPDDISPGVVQPRDVGKSCTESAQPPERVVQKQDSAADFMSRINHLMPAIKLLLIFALTTRRVNVRETDKIAIFILDNGAIRQKEYATFRNWFAGFRTKRPDEPYDEEAYADLLSSISPEILKKCQHTALWIAKGSGRKPIDPEIIDWIDSGFVMPPFKFMDILSEGRERREDAYYALVREEREREEAAKLEAARQKKEQVEAAKQERERAKAARLEAKRQKEEQAASIKQEKARAKAEKLEAARQKKEKADAAKLERVQAKA